MFSPGSWASFRGSMQLAHRGASLRDTCGGQGLEHEEGFVGEASFIGFNIFLSRAEVIAKDIARRHHSWQCPGRLAFYLVSR
mmetsp:Transcript_154993/g.496798  ORF Transcript_154993/g.496798 Transcript_154993/m.496798 type:complete len:82 (-) Transcript_154993:444-689(-)